MGYCNGFKKMKSNFKLMRKNDTITPNLIGTKVQVYNGKTFSEFTINFNMLNFKIGEFCTTKKKVVHKQKK